jgi:hypothetical protein
MLIREIRVKDHKWGIGWKSISKLIWVHFSHPLVYNQSSEDLSNTTGKTHEATMKRVAPAIVN